MYSYLSKYIYIYLLEYSHIWNIKEATTLRLFNLRDKVYCRYVCVLTLRWFRWQAINYDFLWDPIEKSPLANPNEKPVMRCLNVFHATEIPNGKRCFHISNSALGFTTSLLTTYCTVDTRLTITTSWAAIKTLGEHTNLLWFYKLLTLDGKR